MIPSRYEYIIFMQHSGGETAQGVRGEANKAASGKEGVSSIGRPVLDGAGVAPQDLS